MGSEEKLERTRYPEAIAFGRRLAMAREGRKWTQGQLGNRMGISSKQISHYETGASEFPMRRLYELARVLNVPIGYFFDEDTPTVSQNAADQEWLGYLGRRAAMIPPGRARDRYKERLREFADSEADFLKRLSEEGIGK